MASFAAELRVAGHIFPVLHCTYQTGQDTDARGRVNGKVRNHPVELVLNVPDGSILEGWAAAPHKRLAADVVFFAAAGGQPLETLSLKAAYCVQYEETFLSGSVTTGAYHCRITLSDPNGFTLHAGGPGTFAAPAAREHTQLIASTPTVPPPAPVIISTCTESFRLSLQNQVKQNCKSGKQSCLISDACPVLEETMQTLNACIAARTRINMVCYKGGDEGHKIQILNKINSLVTCQGYYANKCNKTPQPAPVPRRQPADDPVNVPTIPKEVPLTIAGAGLFILYLLSGALRPGPI